VVTVAGVVHGQDPLGDQAVQRAEQPGDEQQPVTDQAHGVAAERPSRFEEGQGDAHHREPDADDLAPGQPLADDPAQERAPDRHRGQHDRSP
jgi:hypothetical protein